MKVYFAYFRYYCRDDNSKYLIKNICPLNIHNIGEGSEILSGLYAFTKDKECMKIFKKIHKKDVFYYTTRTMTKEEYDELVHYNKDLEIEWCDFEDLEYNIIVLPMVNHEKRLIREFASDVIYDILIDIITIDPRIFKGESRKILDQSGYTVAFLELYGHPDITDLIDYNISYGAYDSVFQLIEDSSDLAKYIIIYSHLILDELKLLKHISEII